MALGVGLIGCGDISDIYFQNAARFRDYDIVACASRRLESAEAKGARYGVPAVTVDALLADPAVDVMLNLTPPGAHLAVSEAALDAGKHVYSEKPLTLTVAEAGRLAARADAAGLRIGCAPDTCLGAAVQTARRLVAGGAIGVPLFAMASFLSPGPEWQHPAPAFFYEPGGGPVHDMGPYYLAALVAVLGPVAEVGGRAVPGLPERVVRHQNAADTGAPLTISVPTTVAATLTFASGATAQFVASWDAHAHGQPHIEIHGTAGSLRLPDPDWFGGDVLLAERPGEWRTIPTDTMVYGRPNRTVDGAPTADYRGLGLAEMASAILGGRDHRLNAAFATHVLDICQTVVGAAKEGKPRHTATGAELTALSEVEAAALLA